MLQSLFILVNSFANFASFCFFQGSALFIVQTLQFFKFLGADMSGVLGGTKDIVAEGIIRAAMLLRSVVVSFIGSCLNFLCSMASWCCKIENHEAKELVEMMEMALSSFWNKLPGDLESWYAV